MTNPLEGRREDRTNEAARAGILMTAANARFVLAEIESQIKSEKKRRAMALRFSSNILGKLSAEAVEVYKAYAAGGDMV